MSDPVVHAWSSGAGMVRAGWTAVACALAAASGAAPASAEVTVALRARAEAEGKLVRVRDIARVEGDEPELVERVASVLLGAMPEPGDVKTIARNHVVARISQEGLSLSRVVVCGENWVAVTAPARATLPAEVVEIAPGSEIVRSIRAHVAEELRCRAEALEVQLISLQWVEPLRAIGALEYAAVRRTAGDGLGRGSYLVDALAGTARAGRALVWVETVHYRDAVAARRTVKPREVIGSEDVVVTKVPVRDPRATFVEDPAEAVGREAARAIAAHEPIAPSAVCQRPLVRKGDLVTVLVETPHCKIADQARAEESGALGQVISVQNTRSNKTYLARIIDAQMVAAVP